MSDSQQRRFEALMATIRESIERAQDADAQSLGETRCVLRAIALLWAAHDELEMASCAPAVRANFV